MAKQPPPKNGTSRIRFIMLDAEIPEGDLTQITAAIQNALRPATLVQHRPTSRPLLPVAGASEEAEEVNSEAVADDVEEAVPPPVAKAPRAAKPRKVITPPIIEFDFTSDVSLENFASQYSPKGEPDRQLIIAAWFKEHRDTPTVTASHIYTGYRTIGWSANFEDFSWPLRLLKKDKYINSSARGEYAINHIGLGRVQKMRKSE